MRKTLGSLVILSIMIPASSVLAKTGDIIAGTSTVDCSKKTLQSEIDKLDKTVANALEITGDCNEDITVSGHADLTLIGLNGASITSTGTNTDLATVTVDNRSRISFENLTLNGGANGLVCTGGSYCTLLNVTVQDGAGGVAAQDQSSLNIRGISAILNSGGSGVGVYGASSVNVQPEWASGFDDTEAGPTISGHATGVWVQDGSFFRSDNASITNNSTGVMGRRNATLKVFNQAGTGSVSSNSGTGINVQQGSTAQIFAEIHDNGGAGVQIGSLSFAQVFSVFSSNGGDNVQCVHPTAVSQDDQNGGGPTCP